MWKCPDTSFPARRPTFRELLPAKPKRAGTAPRPCWRHSTPRRRNPAFWAKPNSKKCPTFAVPDLLVEHARLHDLTILPVPEGYDQWYAEAVIFGSGRPVLVFPEGPRARAFELGPVTIAWDFSPILTRGVSDAMPLLE